MGSGQSCPESSEAWGIVLRSCHCFWHSLAVTLHDPDHSVSELRFVTVGTSVAGRILIVAHTERDERTRIISARHATQGERKDYEEEN
jgi:hypothetical protein